MVRIDKLILTAVLLATGDAAAQQPARRQRTSEDGRVRLETVGEGAYAYVFDASGIEGTDGLRQLYDFLQPRISKLAANGRVLLLSRAAADAGSVAGYTASMALRGFTKSLGKEIGKKGATAGAGTPSAS